jgi:hypothetical protein
VPPPSLETAVRSNVPVRGPGAGDATHPPTAELAIDAVGVAQGALELDLKVCQGSSNINAAPGSREPQSN